MSHMIAQKHSLDKDTEQKYANLYRKAVGLIGYVASQLPEGAKEEIIYDSFLKATGGMSFEERYIINNNGIFEATKNGSGKGRAELDLKKVDPLDLIKGNTDIITDDEKKVFNKLFDNLQQIINKYEIEIPKEFL